MAGLSHPADLGAWQDDQRRGQGWRRRLRARAGALTHRGHEVEVATRASDPAAPARVLVVLDALTTTSRRALLGPAAELGDPVTVVGPPGVDELLTGDGWQVATVPASQGLPRLVGPRTVALSTGHYLPLGGMVEAVAAERGGRFVTVQHGLLTPHAPPLARGTTLLAWSEADGLFWRSGREDVETHVVGSQLLWDAAETPADPVDPAETPVFLGQLHGAELPRAVLEGAAEGFCRDTGAIYRPHPAEVDRRSRATHRRWERQGITVDRSATPLRELGRPVVSVFSTGVLEAAAAGVPSWVHLPEPPGWVEEFWARYGLSPWGSAPTPSPERPAVSPSRAVALAVREMMDG